MKTLSNNGQRTNIYDVYESEKRKIQALNLSPKEYTEAIKELAKRLKI